MKAWLNDRRVLAAVFLLSGLFCWLLSPSGAKKDERSVSLDEQIPAGSQLVPIKIENATALNSVLDGFGTVDLYLGSRRVARSVKIVRGVHNPEEFAVLIPESYVGLILGTDLPYRVVIRSRDSGGTRIEAKQTIVHKPNLLRVEALNEEKP